MSVWDIEIFILRNLGKSLLEVVASIKINRKFLSPRRKKFSEGVACVDHFCVIEMSSHQFGHLFSFCAFE